MALPAGWDATNIIRRSQMIMTYVDGKYRINTESDNARELIKELAQCIKSIAQDIIALDEANAHKVAVMITHDLLTVCPAPFDDPSN